MATQEISSRNWATFCNRCNEMLHGTNVTLQLVTPEGEVRELSGNTPLQKMEFDRTGACSDVLRIVVDDPERKEFVHSITEPIHLRVREEAGDRKVLEISAEEGSTRMIFHSGKYPMLLEGLEAA